MGDHPGFLEKNPCCTHTDYTHVFKLIVPSPTVAVMTSVVEAIISNKKKIMN